MLWFKGRLTEAEQAYRKALDLRRKGPGIDIAAESSCKFLLEIFQRQKRLDEISPLLTKVVDPAVLSKRTFSGGSFRTIFESAIKTLAQHGLWDDADALTDRMQKAIPENATHYQMRAPLLVVRGDVDGYRRLCEKMISHSRPLISPYMNPALADPTAKDCLIIPASGLDLKPVAAMADIAAARGSNSSVRCCKALAEFRLGHYEESVKWAQLAAKSRTSTHKLLRSQPCPNSS